MAKRKKGKVEDLVGQLIAAELEKQLSRLVARAKKRAIREAGKLNEVCQLEYHSKDEVIEAEYQEAQPSEAENPEVVKKTIGNEGGE